MIEFVATRSPTTTRSTSSGDVIYGHGLKSNKSALLTRLICSPAVWEEGFEEVRGGGSNRVGGGAAASVAI